MSVQPLQVLVVESVGALDLPGADALGPLAWNRCASLDDATAALAADSFDAVLLCLSAAQAAALPGWAALPRAVASAAVLVHTPGEPVLEVALRLVRLGVQDVLGGSPDTLPRALRLAAERRAQQESARKALGTDSMTGLPDRAQLTEQMTQLLALREREPAPMVLLAVRLEGLAAAEASLGREAANALRRKVAVRLRVGLRAGDVVASLAPDLLGVLLARVQEAGDGQRVADKLRQALQGPFGVAGSQVVVSPAIGIARYPDDGRDAATLLRVAAGQAASSGGRGTSAAANDPV